MQQQNLVDGYIELKRQSMKQEKKKVFFSKQEL